jgi:hypothetical protein
MLGRPLGKGAAKMNATWFGEVWFWGFLICAALTFALLVFHRERLAKPAGWLALAAGLAMIGGISAQTGRPPLSGALESLGLMALWLAVLALLSQYSGAARSRLAAMTWGAVVLLLVILVWVPRQVNPDWFLYQYGWTRSFFLCRLTALPLLLYSSLIALAWPAAEPENGERRLMISRSRRFLLLGTAVFLVGEVSGFYWCLTWRGDYWLWNRNFLESTMIFLLASAALHLPPKLAARPRALRLFYGLPGLLAMTAYLVHQISEAYL